MAFPLTKAAVLRLCGWVEERRSASHPGCELPRSALAFCKGTLQLEGVDDVAGER